MSARTRSPIGAEVDVPLTVLLSGEERGADPALGRLAARLATRLGHAVRPCPLDERGTALVARLRRPVSRGTRRVVLLPLDLERAGAAGPRVERALAAVQETWPVLRLHRGAPPAGDDVARILGDRARAAARALGRGRGASGEAPAGVVAVLVGGGGTSPAGNAELARLARLVYEGQRFAEVAHAFLDLTSPGVGQVVSRWERLGARGIVLVPHLLFDGPARRKLESQGRAAARATGVPVVVARPLDPHPALVWILVRRHLEALTDASLLPPGADEALPWVHPGLLRGLRDAHGHAHGPAGLDILERRLAALLPPRYREPGRTVSAAPMAAAPLQRTTDGRIAWDRTWQGFCELGLAGGPPHRGTLLEAPAREEVLADPAGQAAVLEELARGVRSVTGLDVTADAAPGWIGVRCHSPEMALWLLRAVVVENVMARREGAVLYLPAGPAFRLEGETKNVITALAKTHHYWTQHVAGLAPPPPTRPG